MHDISYRNRRLKWQRSIDVFRTKREQEVADSLESGINKGFKILKKKKSVINDQKDTLEKKLEEKYEKMQRYDSNMFEVSNSIKKKNKQLDEKFENITKRNE